jgi:hypothetical protein
MAGASGRDRTALKRLRLTYRPKHIGLERLAQTIFCPGRQMMLTPFNPK